MYNNSQQQHVAHASVANQYNYTDPMSPIGYNPNMQHQQDLEQHYAGYHHHQQQLLQQQQQTSQFYNNNSFGTQGYPCKLFFDHLYNAVSYHIVCD